MEWIGPLLIGILVFGGLVQLFSAHAISAIARETGQGELMQILAWIPIFQITPTLTAGRGSVGRCLIGALALIAGNATLVAMSDFLGNRFGHTVAILGMAISGLLCLYLLRTHRLQHRDRT